MSLCLGRLGRKIVDFSITNKTAGKILNGNFSLTTFN